MSKFDPRKAKLVLRVRRKSAQMIDDVNLILNALGFIDPDMVDLEYLDVQLVCLAKDTKLACDLIANYYAAYGEEKK